MAWDPATLKPLFDQLIPTVEQVTVHQITTRAAKARLPGALIHAIEDSAKWSAPAKKAIELAGPQVAAKYLNKAGISAENQPELVLATAVASILASHVLLIRRLDKLIVAANVGTGPSKPGQSQSVSAQGIPMSQPQRPPGAPPNVTMEVKP